MSIFHVNIRTAFVLMGTWWGWDEMKPQEISLGIFTGWELMIIFTWGNMRRYKTIWEEHHNLRKGGKIQEGWERLYEKAIVGEEIHGKRWEDMGRDGWR
jgi:hypothetical protein